MSEFIEVETKDCEPHIRVGAKVKSAGRVLTVTEIDPPFFTAEGDGTTAVFAWGERGVGTIGVESRSLNENVTTFICGPQNATCKCNCPESCEHKWDGPGVNFEWGENGATGNSVTCSRCGMTAFGHDIWVAP